MKSVPTTIKNRLAQGIAVYSSAYVDFPVGLSTYRKTLTPAEFRVTGNSYTANGGDGFPLGRVISKSVTLTISNLHNEWDQYDWSSAIIELRSDLYLNGLSENPYHIVEGQFYVDSVRYVQSAIEVIAYDALAQTNFDFGINNRDPATGNKLYDTIWDYFVYLCDTVIANRLGITIGSDVHLYASHLETDRFPNSDFPLDTMAVTQASDIIALREVLGYIAQLAGGNIVMTYETSSPYFKIDVVSYDLPESSDFYTAMTFEDNLTDEYNAGTFTNPSSDIYSAGIFSDLDYIALDKYLTPPTLEYSDTVFTGVRLTYPVRNTDDATAEYVSSERNVIELSNPLCQVAENSTTEAARVRAAAGKIYNLCCQRPIRPFSGSFINNPLIEFMDNVLVIDAHGMPYYSFVGEHTLNYLGESDISNETPTVKKNNRVFYR